MTDKLTLTPAQPSAMDLLAELARKTDDPTVSVAVAQSIVALQQNIERFNWEREERQAKIDFDEALARIQGQIGRIAPDKQNPGIRGNAWFLSYAKLDQVIRPLYTEAGFSVSFGEADCPVPGKIRVVASVSRGGVTRQFVKDVTPPLLGPKGEAVMTPTHGDTSANSYARRYLMYDIFNIAVGVDADDDDGSPSISQEDGAQYVSIIREAATPEATMAAWTTAVNTAKRLTPIDYKAMTIFTEARDERLKTLRKGAK